MFFASGPSEEKTEKTCITMRLKGNKFITAGQTVKGGKE